MSLWLGQVLDLYKNQPIDHVSKFLETHAWRLKNANAARRLKLAHVPRYVCKMYMYMLVDPLAGVDTNRSLLKWLTGLLVDCLSGLPVESLLCLLLPGRLVISPPALMVD